MKKALIDANVILRYLTKDPPEMAEAALRIFENAQKGKILLIVIPLIVAEVVWVLESFYDYPKTKIAEIMSQFLLCEGLIVEDLDLIFNALTLYREKNLDFADAFLAAIALQRGPRDIYSFDKDFSRIPELIIPEPGRK
jgi:predicted nucleic-acid-binding protein